MKAKFGAIVVAGRGKLGGHVASKNRGGAYFRTKVTPSNPQTSYQTVVRERFAGRSQGWRGLTADERSAWNGAVGSFQGTDIFGDSITPSGFNLHSRVNCNLLNISENEITTPPAVEAVQALTSLSVTAAKAIPALSVTFAPAIDASTKFTLWATPGMSAGKSYLKSDYRQIAVLDSTDTSPYDGLTDYTARFGTIPTAGLKIGIKLVGIGVASGINGAPITATCIVAT